MSTGTDTSRKGYAIFIEEITDWDRYLNDYLPTAAETIEDHDGTVIVGETDPDVIEREWGHNFTVVVEFPSIEDAQAWYRDPAYEEVIPIRHEVTEYADAIITRITPIPPTIGGVAQLSRDVPRTSLIFVRVVEPVASDRGGAVLNAETSNLPAYQHVPWYAPS